MTTERSVEEIAREAMREAQNTGHLDPIVDALEAERKKREELDQKYTALKKAGDGLKESLKWFASMLPILEAEHEELTKNQPAKTATECFMRLSNLQPYYQAKMAIQAYDEAVKEGM